MKLMAAVRKIEVEVMEKGPRKLTESELEHGKIEVQKQEKLQDHSVQFQSWLGRHGDFEQ